MALGQLCAGKENWRVARPGSRVCSFMVGILSSRLLGFVSRPKRHEWPFEYDKIATKFGNLSFVPLRFSFLRRFGKQEKVPQQTVLYMYMLVSQAPASVLSYIYSLPALCLGRFCLNGISYTPHTNQTKPTQPNPSRPHPHLHNPPPHFLNPKHGRTMAQHPKTNLPTRTASHAEPQRRRTASGLECSEPRTTDQRSQRKLRPHARVLGLAYVDGDYPRCHYSRHDERESC